jgi:hypothetical protein
MKKIFGEAWVYFAYFTLTLFIPSVFIYGLDLSAGDPDVKDKDINLYNYMSNERSTVFHFKVNEEFKFMIDREAPEAERVIGLGMYKPNHFPFCYFCGYYRSPYGYEKSRGFPNPYRHGDMAYSVEPEESDYYGLPPGSYATFNLKTEEFGHVMSLDEIAPDADNPKHRLQESYVLENYSLMSFYDHEDEDCQIAFGLITCLVGILIIWALFSVPIRYYKRRKQNR